MVGEIGVILIGVVSSISGLDLTPRPPLHNGEGEVASDGLLLSFLLILQDVVCRIVHFSNDRF